MQNMKQRKLAANFCVPRETSILRRRDTNASLLAARRQGASTIQHEREPVLFKKKYVPSFSENHFIWPAGKTGIPTAD
jgi:hypothetical protein